jgi:hypothetical protein
MKKTNIFITLVLTFVILFAQVGNAAAAPLAQTTTPIIGTIQSITPETDANGVTTILVTLTDELGATQTVRLSVDTAVTLGLVTLDPTTNEPIVVESQIGQPVEIDPVTVIPDDATEEEAVHPISALLAGFFGEDASVIDTYHTDGFGFGLIAQALWMSKNINEDASLAGDILEAKKSGDYSAFTEYFEDGALPTNWGQFRKALLNKKQNLGVVVSGQDDASNNSSQPEHGNGKDKDKGKDKDNGNGNNKNKDKGKDH